MVVAYAWFTSAWRGRDWDTHSTLEVLSLIVNITSTKMKKRGDFQYDDRACAHFYILCVYVCAIFIFTVFSTILLPTILLDTYLNVRFFFLANGLCGFPSAHAFSFYSVLFLVVCRLILLLGEEEKDGWWHLVNVANRFIATWSVKRFIFLHFFVCVLSRETVEKSYYNSIITLYKRQHIHTHKHSYFYR